MSSEEPVQISDIVWKDDLQARVYTPAASLRTERYGAAVVDVHGGAWNSQDRTLGARYCEAVAAAGFTVVAVDFRDGRTARHPAGSDDVVAAVGWVRGQAEVLDIDPERVALMGSSSGGQL